tara:strand:- start:273 stop:863 length:591 start_codon:yes stop_codon:yes gene_type:complete
LGCTLDEVGVDVFFIAPNCGIGDAGATVIAKVLSRHSCLSSLILESNKIGEKGAKALADALEVNRSLVNLDLHINKMKLEGIQFLAHSLCFNEKLASLRVRKNGASGKSLRKCFKDTLKTNASLTYIDVAHDFTFEGCERNRKAIALAKSSALCLVWIWKLKKNPDLNKISKDCVKIIAKMVWKSAGLMCWVEALL